MKSQLIAIVAAVLLVGCGESQQSAPQAEPVEPVAEVAQPVNPMADRAPSDAAKARNIEALKQYLAACAGCVDLRGLSFYPQPT